MVHVSSENELANQQTDTPESERGNGVEQSAGREEFVCQICKV